MAKGRGKPLSPTANAERCNLLIGAKKSFGKKQRKDGSWYNIVYHKGGKRCDLVAITTFYVNGQRRHRCLSHLSIKEEAE